LRDKQAGSRIGETVGLCQRAEGAQLSQGDIHHNSE
jgi:hypothetical protein